MKPRITIHLLSPLFLALFLLTNLGNAGQTSFTDAAKRKTFQAVEKLALAGKPVPKQLKNLLLDYPLYPYVEYARLKSTLGHASQKDIAAFLETYADTPLASLLRSRWLSLLASRKDWKNFVVFYSPQSSITRQCHYLNALIQTGDRNAAFEQTESLWLYGKSCQMVSLILF